jgi:excisionase family DNA binding protein
MEPRLLTVAQVAKQLGVHPNTVRNWCDKGLLECVKLPTGYRRFTQDSIDRLIEEMQEGKAAA